MFQWSGRNLMVMVAPWAAVSQQRYTCVDIRVAEDPSPSYALVFTATLLETGEAAQRRVTKRLMAQTFERTISEPQGRLAAMRTRAAGKLTGEFNGAVDAVVREWIGPKAARPPTREQLVLWLLSRMLLAPAEKGWKLFMCSEQDADVERDAIDLGAEEGALTLDEGLRPTSPPPPPYSARSGRSDRALSVTSDDSFSFDHGDIGDQGETQTHPHTDEESEEVPAGQQASQVRKEKQATQDEQLKTRRRTSAFTKDGGDTTKPIQTKSPYRFEPAAVRVKSHRSLSINSTPSTNAWSEERHHFELELAQSRRDIEVSQERQRKAEAIATLRRKQTIEQNQRKLYTHEQKLHDSRVVKQSISDALEYHDIARRMESQLKQTRISATREQERLSQSMRVALGRSGEKWRKGPVLGTGPLSQIEIDVLTKRYREPIQPPMWVYDLHGRRHHHTSAESVSSESVFESAMKKIQRLLLRESHESVDMFRKYDLDNSGTIEYSEFKDLLQRNGVILSTEQATALFQHFDPNNSGAVDYGELLWGFFNRRAFIKRWKQRKTKLCAREIKMMFYKYDRTGRGALSPRDFQLALDDIGFRVSDAECKLLCVKFDTNKDRFIDYNEFHAFVNDDEDGSREQRGQGGSGKIRPAKEGAERLQRRRSMPLKSKTETAQDRSSIESRANNSMTGMDRIFLELRELNAMQEEINRFIK